MFYLNASMAFNLDRKTTTTQLQSIRERFLDPEKKDPDLTQYHGKVKDVVFFYLENIEYFL